MLDLARKSAALVGTALIFHMSPAAPQSLLTTIAVEQPPERMAMTPDGSRVYGVGRFDNNITVIDTQTDSILKVIARSASAQPGDWSDDVVISADGARVYVASGGLNQLSVVDTATNAIVADIAVGNNPTSLVVTPDGKKVYVSNAGAGGMGMQVAVVDAATLAVVATVPFFTVALSKTMAVHPSGSRVYVAGSSGNVGVIDTATNTLIGNIPANGWRMAMSPDGSRLYVHSQFASRIDVVDTSTDTIIASIPAPGSGPDPEVIVATADGKRVFATHFGGSRVSVIDTAASAVIASLPFAVFPVGLATSPDSSIAFLATFNSLNWLRIADNAIIATLPLSSDTITGERPVLTPDSAKLYAACSNVCVFGTGIATRRTVAIDIKPGDKPNSINPRSHGVIAVALLGSAQFDVRSVDTASLRFGATGTEATARQVAWSDANGDGHGDLVLHFETGDTGIGCGHIEAALTGALLDGQKLRGTDSIRTVGCR